MITEISAAPDFLPQLLSGLFMLAAGVAAVVNSGNGDDGNSKPSRKAKRIAAAGKPKPPPRIDVKPTKKIWMTPEQWAAVPSNPFQRNKRVEKPTGHLRKYKQKHAQVHMGIYPDGSRCKLDGHSRSHVWQYRPDLVDFIPKRLEVFCYPVRDDDDAAAKFNEYDSRDAVKNAADYVHGSFRLAGIPTTSKFFERCTNIKSSLAYAHAILVRALNHSSDEKVEISKRVDDHVAAFQDALTALDGVNVNNSKLTAPFITAFLLAHYKHGNAVVDFFTRINEGVHGRKQGKKYCVIGKLESDRDKHVGAGQQQHLKLVAKILGALDTFMQGKFTQPGYQPPVNIEQIMSVDLDVYLLQDRAKRTARGDARNSLLKEQKKKN